MKLKVGGAVGCAKLRHFICMRCSELWSCLIKDSEVALCPSCSFPGEQRFTAPTVTSFREGYYEHSSADGVHASTMAQLEEDCERSGNRLEDRGELPYAKHRRRWV